MKQITKYFTGTLLCFSIALPAWFLGKAFPIAGGPVFGILAGMALSMTLPRLLCNHALGLEEGVKFTSKSLLQVSIILLGFGMNLFHVLEVGRQTLYVIFFTLSASFLAAYFAGKALRLDGKMTVLIGVGTSICGGSAIAATAPVICAKDEDVAHSISTIFLFNVLAVFIFPALGSSLGMSDTGFGMWAGTAINDTSSVVASATAWSEAAGNDAALGFATVVKLTRTLMIVPVTLFLAVYTAAKTEINEGPKCGRAFQVLKIFPWFVLGFVAASVVNTFWGVPLLSGALVAAGKFMIVMAMAAIGLKTNLPRLLTNGFKPVLTGLCCWVSVAGVSLVVQQLSGTW